MWLKPSSDCYFAVCICRFHRLWMLIMLSPLNISGVASSAGLRNNPPVKECLIFWRHVSAHLVKSQQLFPHLRGDFSHVVLELVQYIERTVRVSVRGRVLRSTNKANPATTLNLKLQIPPPGWQVGVLQRSPDVKKELHWLYVTLKYRPFSNRRILFIKSPAEGVFLLLVREFSSTVRNTSSAQRANGRNDWLIDWILTQAFLSGCRRVDG